MNQRLEQLAPSKRAMLKLKQAIEVLKEER